MTNQGDLCVRVCVRVCVHVCVCVREGESVCVCVFLYLAAAFFLFFAAFLLVPGGSGVGCTSCI